MLSTIFNTPFGTLGRIFDVTQGRPLQSGLNIIQGSQAVPANETIAGLAALQVSLPQTLADHLVDIAYTRVGNSPRTIQYKYIAQFAHAEPPGQHCLEHLVSASRIRTLATHLHG